MQLASNNSSNGIVHIIDGRTVTSSRKVAETFNKQHKDVLRAIKNIECSEESGPVLYVPGLFIKGNLESI